MTDIQKSTSPRDTDPLTSTHSPPASVYLALGGLLLLTVVAYWFGLDGPLLLDDRPNLDRLVAMHEGRLTWSEVIADSTAGVFGRPVAMGSFILNWVTSGPDVWALKATNLLLHVLCGVLVFLLSASLLRQPVAGVTRHRWWLALWITAMWLLAPLFVSTVLYLANLLLLPGGSPMGIYHDDYVLSTALTQPLSTLLCLVA